MKQPFEDNDLEQIDLQEDSRDYRYDIEGTDNYDEDTEEDQDSEEDSARLSKIIQIIIISFIVIILFSSVFLLIRWQQGTDPDATDLNHDAAYDVESEDFFVPFDPTGIEGYVDDGENNIVILGDDTILHAQGENGISDLIAESTGANVTTLALSGSCIGLQEKGYTQEYAEDAYNLYYIITSICAGDMGNYDLMFAALSCIDDNSNYYNYWDAIHKVDFNKVDTLIICYGYNDYLIGRRLIGDEAYSQQPYGSENSTAGALDDCLRLLTERFPYMQVIVVSPSFCFVPDKDGNMAGADVYNNGTGTLGDYVIHMKLVSQDNRVSFVDNYFFEAFNYANYEDYLEEDGRFPNEAGRRLIADHIKDFIYVPQ